MLKEKKRRNEVAECWSSAEGKHRKWLNQQFKSKCSHRPEPLDFKALYLAFSARSRLRKVHLTVRTLKPLQISSQSSPCSLRTFLLDFRFVVAFCLRLTSFSSLCF